MDIANLAVIAITFVLFALAVLEKGLTHDLLLEAGVFLVSVKLILMGAKLRSASEDSRRRLDAIQATLDRIVAVSAGVSDANRDLPRERPRPAD
jgi:hypothetical protein